MAQNQSRTTPLRIGFDATWLAANQKSGVGYYVQNLIQALAATYPNEIRLVGHYFAGKGSADQLVQAPNISYKVSRIMPQKVVNMLRRKRIELPFEFFIRQRCDFLIFPAYTSYPSLFHTPSTTIIYDLAYHDMPETLSPRNQKDLIRNVPRSIARASFVTTISEWTKQRIETVYRTDKPTLVTYIPPVQPNVQHADMIIENLGISKRYILFVGTLEPRKNILGLIDAYQQLPDETRNSYSLILVGGEGWQDNEIKRKLADVKQAGLDVITPGYVSDEQKTALYAQACVFILPSLYEGFGMPLLEAMAVGTPVIASDIPVFHEVCGDAAVYVNQKDTATISAAIGKVLSSETLQQKLITAGTKNLERFSWPQVAHDFFDHIQKTVEAGNKQ